MEAVKDEDYHYVAGLYEALTRDDRQKVIEMLSTLRKGDRIRVVGMLLEVDEPTTQERELLKRSRKEKKEFALIIINGHEVVIEGKRGEVNPEKVWAEAKPLLDANPEGKRVFSHTHYDDEYAPIPSGSDVTLMRNYHIWSFECRVISWVENKVFIYRGTS